MTNEQRIRCHSIIHSAAVAAGGGNVLPIPGLGLAADFVALAGMAIGLAAVFGQNLPMSVAKTMAYDALLRQPANSIIKSFSKLVPFLGSVVSVGLVEAAGWSIANDLDRG